MEISIGLTLMVFFFKCIQLYQDLVNVNIYIAIFLLRYNSIT
jgi:hypothetical protein